MDRLFLVGRVLAGSSLVGYWYGGVNGQACVMSIQRVTQDPLPLLILFALILLTVWFWRRFKNR